MDYWKECISHAFDDADIEATEEQIDIVAETVKGAHENYGMAHGYDVIGNPAEAMAREKLRKFKQKIEKEQAWKNSTDPCTTCHTDGFVDDVYGRLCECPDCDGKGRVKRTIR